MLKIDKRICISYICSQLNLSILLLLATCFSFPAAAAKNIPSWKESHILVQPLAGLEDEAFEHIIKQHGGKAVGQINKLRVKIINVPAGAEDAVVRALRKNKHISFAEKDMLVQSSEIIPNDPNYSSAWHLQNMNTNPAWEVTLGEGIVVAIIDTGVDSSHPDLAAQMLPGWNAVSNNDDSSDAAGHGTAVAGVVAASSNNNLGVTSIAWNTLIMPVRITNSSDGWAYWSDIAKGLSWAADNGAHIANISYSISNSSTVTSAAQYMRSKGGLVISSAGNDGNDTGYSDNPYIITVAAIDKNNSKTSWSNYGTFIDVTAPGLYIMTTTRGGGYKNWSGTSFSSPAAAGVAALIMSANPNLSPEAVEAILENSADDLVSGETWHPYFGHGRVNAGQAIQLAVETEISDNIAPEVSIFSPGDNSTIKGQVTIDVNASDNIGVSQVTLYADNQLIGTDKTAPYQFSWDSTSVADGSVVFTAYAIDSANNEGISNEVFTMVENASVVNDTIPPMVEISNPRDGSTIVKTVNIRVIASDDILLDHIQLFLDDELKSSSSTGNLSYDWNTRKLNSGNHTIEAIATDTAGNSSRSVISIIVGSSTNPGKGRKK